MEVPLPFGVFHVVFFGGLAAAALELSPPTPLARAKSRRVSLTDVTEPLRTYRRVRRLLILGLMAIHLPRRPPILDRVFLSSWWPGM